MILRNYIALIIYEGTVIYLNESASALAGTVDNYKDYNSLK